jgi:hypothetical protein
MLDCPDEVLLRILSYYEPKTPETTARPEFYSLILTCKLLHKVTLPFLYRDINCVWYSTEHSLRECSAFKSFIRTINTYPERAAWVQSASFSWNELSTKTWRTIFRLCSRLSSLHTLKLRVLCENEPFPHREFVEPCSSTEICFSKLVHNLSKLPLQDVTVEYARITSWDIESFYALPKL